MLAAAAVAIVATGLAPPEPPSARVAAAARDLPAGTRLRPGDLTVAVLPPAAVPDRARGRPANLIGRTVAAPMRRGEIFTDRRLVGRSLVAGYAAGLVAVPVRIQDGDVVRLLQVGDLINVYAAARADQPAALLVAGAVRVVLVGRPDDRVDRGALVVVGATDQEAAALAGAAGAEISVSLLR